MMARASFSVQQVCTPAVWMPGIGGLAGREPVAISRRSNGTVVPSSSATVRAFVSTPVARTPRRMPMRSFA
jgi:hypothetical protein